MAVTLTMALKVVVLFVSLICMFRSCHSGISVLNNEKCRQIFPKNSAEPLVKVTIVGEECAEYVCTANQTDPDKKLTGTKTTCSPTNALVCDIADMIREGCYQKVKPNVDTTSVVKCCNGVKVCNGTNEFVQTEYNAFEEDNSVIIEMCSKR
ncbi:uncharacterized protein LOC141911278 [Tubulanus polymorphus]|uniref:uncharacterized protein LOC141911278 n=1 Tax=Tubulanus polymorphus TaxID=672921 RepID=UPI003DA3EE41